MRKRRFQPLRLCLLPLFAFFLAACGEKKETEFVGQDFESWYPHYNDYIRQWLARESAEKEGKRKEIDEKLAAADLDAEEREALGEKMRQLDEELARLRFRQGLGDYFAFHEEADLPEGLTWENGADEPAIGDPEARKGGAYNTFMMSFPPTITPFGPNSNNGFRGELYDKVELALIDLHPETARTIPAVAREWAVSEDGRQVFFRLDEAATYSDGVPVRAVDFMWFVFLRASDNVSEPWYKQYFREEIAQIALYGESVVAVTLPAAMPREKMPYFASLRPSPPHFYQDYGPDYAERYQWQVPPT
ncbi:MAG: ABC transporter substrate-binding protein, partial [Verrucomicrobiales bacterium]